MVDHGMESPFQSVRPHFDALARVAYFKIVLKPNVSRMMHSLHNAFRAIIWILVVTYNLQHLIRVVQIRHSTDQIVDTLFILLTTLNTLGKQLTFNLRSSRIDNIINIISGPLFAPYNSDHTEIMKKNTLEMAKLLKICHAGIITCGSLWAVFPLVNKALGEEVQFTGYIPFDTSYSPVFELTVAYMSIAIAIQGYGNVTMDCTIVAFYAQARFQIQMLRYNLERLVVPSEGTKIQSFINRYNENKYEDNGNMKTLIQNRFVRCVQHYQKIVWFSKEIESIFGEAMVVQFFVMAWVICMTVYKIAGLSILSVEFVSITVYLGCMLSQLFIYCYYGTQLKVESEFINQSLYSGNWLDLSPQFRRQLLVMMKFCSRPLAPRTAYIIPMSLETYIEVLKFSYTLFTFLDNK